MPPLPGGRYRHSEGVHVGSGGSTFVFLAVRVTGGFSCMEKKCTDNEHRSSQNLFLYEALSHTKKGDLYARLAARQVTTVRIATCVLTHTGLCSEMCVLCRGGQNVYMESTKKAMHSHRTIHSRDTVMPSRNIMATRTLPNSREAIESFAYPKETGIGIVG